MSIINDNNINISNLFYKVWKNVVVRNQILYYLKLYNAFHSKRIISNFDQLKTKESEYYNSLMLHYNIRCNSKPNNIETLKEWFKLLSHNVEYVELSSWECENVDITELLPSTVSKLIISYYTEFSIKAGSIPNTLKSLDLGNMDKINTQNVQNLIESLPVQGLTYLKIGASYKGTFKTALPLTLKTFKCSLESTSEPFNFNCLPNSITDLDFSLNSYKYMKSNCFNELPNLSLTLCNLKSLNLSNYNSSIKNGYLPSTLETLILSNDFDADNNLTEYSIPESVTVLKFSNQIIESYDFVWGDNDIKNDKTITLLSNKLPKQLNKLMLGPFHKLIINDNSNGNSLNNLKSIKYVNSFHSLQVPKSIINLKCNGNRNKVSTIEIPNQIESLLLRGNIEISNSNQSSLDNLTKLQLSIYCKISNFKNMPSLTTLRCGLDVKTVTDKSFYNVNTIQFFSIYGNLKKETFIPPCVTCVELITSSSVPIDTSLLPQSVNTLIISGYCNDIILPISPNLKSIFTSSPCYSTLFNNLNFIDNPHLLDTIKVIDTNLDIFNKLSNKKLK